MAEFTKPRVVILASGAGSTFAALVEAVRQGRLDAEIVALVVDRECGALNLAAQLEVEALLVERRKDDQSWPGRMTAAIESFRPDYIVLAGFLRKVPIEIVRAFQGRVFNTHPALLPKFGGKGMYGRRVHEAVLAAGESETGVTLHHVTENYDEGTPLAQIRIPVKPGETAIELEERLKKIEKEFLITELQKLWRAGKGSP